MVQGISTGCKQPVTCMPFLRLAFLYIMHQSFVTTAPETLGMDIFMVTVIPKALPNSWQVNVKLLSLVRAWNQKPHRSTALQEQRLAQNMALKPRYVNAIPRSICSLCESSWSVPGHLSDTLKFSAGQNKNLLDRHKKTCLFISTFVFCEGCRTFVDRLKISDDSIKNERASMETPFSHYKSMGNFLDAQGQLTP